MKQLSRYILKEHLPPFLFAFLAITFLLIIEYVPKIVSHVIDKDLSPWIVLELVGLNIAWMMALSVPMAVLVATLMAFGRLSSDSEIIAIKASGINLARAILPVLGAGLVVTLGMIQFNDTVLPNLNKLARQLSSDISAMRPTLVFRSGVFISDIPGYTILIQKIDHATSRVDEVSISDTRNSSTPKIVIAEYGFLEMIDDDRIMQFTLYNGEIHSLDLAEPENYRKVDFEKHVINIEGVDSRLHRSDSEYRNDREMAIKQMMEIVDRARKGIAPYREKINSSLKSKINSLFSNEFSYHPGEKLPDSAALAVVVKEASIFNVTMERNKKQIVAKQKSMAKYNIEIYKKYSIPAASLAFVLVGAPLAAMSRRGGMGIAIAISILFFTIYWASLMGGEDLADRGLVPAFWAMWGANILIGSVGLYLIFIVSTERKVFGFFRKK